MHEKVAQPAVTNAILKRHGFHMRKGLGQNFLTDPQILQKIVAAADVLSLIHISEPTRP